MRAIEKPKSLTEIVTNTLRQEIIDGEFALGEALSETMISNRLDVSRTPVREAFARLEVEGLLRTVPQHGTFVFTLNEKEMQDICELRCCLESEALRLGIKNNSGGLASALRQTVDEMEESRRRNDPLTYLRLDTRFHQELFDYSGNGFLNDSFQTISAKISTLRNRLRIHAVHLDKGFHEHVQLVDCVARRDTEEGLRIVHSHTTRIEGTYWSLSLEGRMEIIK